MSTDGRGSVRDFSGDQFRLRDDNWAILFCQRRVADGLDVLSHRALPPLSPPLLGESGSAPVNVTQCISVFNSFLNLRRLACMELDGEQLNPIDAPLWWKTLYRPTCVAKTLPHV